MVRTCKAEDEGRCSNENMEHGEEDLNNIKTML